MSAIVPPRDGETASTAETHANLSGALLGLGVIGAAPRRGELGPRRCSARRSTVIWPPDERARASSRRSSPAPQLDDRVLGSG